MNYELITHRRTFHGRRLRPMVYEFITCLLSRPRLAPHHFTCLQLGRDEPGQFISDVLVLCPLQERSHHG
jgi:hypothetical protein